MADESKSKNLLNIRISKAQKKKWKEYADEEGHGSLTNLIKHSVESTISDEWVLRSETDINIDTDSLDLGLSELDNRLQAIEHQLDALQGPQQEDDKDRNLDRDELIQLANRCHDLLPQVPTEEHLQILTEHVVPFDSAEKPMLTGTAEDIANELDEPVFAVRQALIWLEQEQHAGVESMIDGGVRRWYELDPSMKLSDIESELDIDNVQDLVPDGIDDENPLEFESQGDASR